MNPKPEAKASGGFWFIAKEKVLSGPFSYEQLLSELASGKLEPGDYCWRQGFQEWRPLCSVEDFGFPAKPYVVRAYPLVPVPSAKSSSSETSASRPAASTPATAAKVGPGGVPLGGSKTVKVRLETQRRMQVGVWERVAMIVFAICFAWAATWVALSEVQESFMALYEKRVAGSVVVLGDTSHMNFVAEGFGAEETLAREPASLRAGSSEQRFWNFQQLSPVLGAPGLEAFEKDAWPVREMVQRPMGSPLETAVVAQAWSLASGHAVQWSSETHGDVNFVYAADPIYVQPYEVHGTWSASDPKIVHVRTLGHPGL